MKNIDDHSRAVRIGLFSGKGGFRAGIRDLKSGEKGKKKNARRLYVKIDLPVMKGCLSPVSFGRTNGLRAKKPAVSIVMASRSRCFALEGILIGNSPRKKARDIL